MTVNICSALLDAYKKTKKNPNYSISFLLSSLDVKAAKASIGLVENFSLTSKKESFVLDDKNATVIKKAFGQTDENLVEQLLWIALFFPEI